MLAYDVFFFSAAFFLLGILTASIGLGAGLVFVSVLLTGAVFFFLHFGLGEDSRRLFWLAGVALFIFLGHSYYFLMDAPPPAEESFFISSLAGIKNGIIHSFQRVLSPLSSALLSGIVLGERSEFPRHFREAMIKSGTVHLTALSGYNINLVGLGALAAFNYFLSKRLSLFLGSLAIIGFVLMTGASASAVRAGIMGLVLFFAEERGGSYDLRNVIIFTALAMVLFNPRLLYFDVSFQLSFAAFLGIIYLKPVLERILKLQNKGFLAWRENLAANLSAQLAVAPLIIHYFGRFEWVSVFSNLLILPVVPVTMALGALVAASSFFYPLSLVFGWLAELVLNYQIFIINLFGS